VDANLQRLRTRFESDPSIAAAFETLEEHHFVNGEWSDLVTLYKRRLESPDLDPEKNPKQRARVAFRLAQVLEERCLQVDRAAEEYANVIRLDPTFQPALAQLRKIYAAQEKWELALQVAEVQAQLPMRRVEKAAFSAEMGEIWHRRLGDAAQGAALFERALESDPNHVPALLGLARTQEEVGDAPAAARALERAIASLRGPDAAAALVQLARLLDGPLEDRARAEELYRRALGEDPRCETAVEGLLEHALAKEDWVLASELYERRFDLASGAQRRTAIAHQGGRLHLERLRDPRGARMWFSRALELFPEDPKNHLALADVERLAGNRVALAEHLRRAADLTGGEGAVEILREIAAVSREQGDRSESVSELRRALEQDPGNAELLEELAADLSRLGRAEELVEILEQQAALATDDPSRRARALARLGSLYEEQLADPEAAIDAFERASSEDPEQAVISEALERLYRKTGSWEKLRRRLEGRLERATGRRSVELHCSLGELMLEQFQDAEAATRHFEAAIDIDPTARPALEGIERIALASGDEDAIVEAFEREASVTTDRSRLSFLVWELVQILEERNQLEEALLWIERLVAAMPEDRRTLEACARLQETLHHASELRETLERLEVLLQGEERAANRRRLATLLAADGETEGAIAAYRGALEANPDDLASLRALQSLLEETGRFREAVEVRRHLAELAPAEERIECLHALAVILSERLDDAESAIPLFAELAGTPGAPQDSGVRLEDLLERTGRFELLSERLSQRRQELDSTSPEVRDLDLRRAEILLDRLGLPAQASDLLRSLHEREPESPKIRESLERALRRSNDALGLCELLETRSAQEQDGEVRATLDLERAAILEQKLYREGEARQLLTALADGKTAAAAEAERRLDALLERLGEWETAHDRLLAKLGRGSAGDDFEIRQRLGALCRDRLVDPDQAIVHLEAAASLRADRDDVWRALARLYQEEERWPDLVRALEAELETGPDPERELILHSRAAELCAHACADPVRAAVHYEKVLALDPTHSVASEFLVEQLSVEERHADLARVLEMRLAALQSGRETAAGARSAGADRLETETSLRLRIAALRSGPLNDVNGAIEILAPAAEQGDALGAVAEPLADLYQRAGRDDELIELCGRAAAGCQAALERADWHLRIGDALFRRGDCAAAAGSYRRVMAERPDDRVAPSALRDIYRRLGESEPLVRLLEAELSRTGGVEEIPIRMELAGLLEGPLSRPADALTQLRRVLQIEPSHAQALRGAMRLAEQTGRAADWLELLEVALERTRNPVERARHLTQRGRLLAGSLARPEEAVESLRSAVLLDAASEEARSELRHLLERLGDWSGLLECLELERRFATRRDPEAQAAICEKAVEIAAAHVSGEMALAWLERLRALRSKDASVVARIAEIHRRAGRWEAAVRTLEEEIALSPDPSRRCALELEQAEILEKRMGAPGRAIAPLEAARASDPASRPVLQRLEELYRVTGQPRRQAEVLELLIAGAGREDRPALRRTAAELYAGALGRPDRAAAQLWEALREAPLSRAGRVDLLLRLSSAFLSMGRKDLWARTAEEELRSLDPLADVFLERRRELQLELARAYDAELGRPDAAIRHLRELVDAGMGAVGAEDPSIFEEAEQALLRLLRASRNDVELEWRLSQHLARSPRAPGEEHDERPAADEGRRREKELWLELARLRRERLHRPCEAADAFREVLARDPRHPDAIRGLRGASEEVGDYGEVARTLEMELEEPGSLTPQERAALYRRLGQVAWQRLDSTTRASRAFAAALEADPSDLASLRSLESLFEMMEDWRGALDLYESEVELLGEAEPERRKAVWIRAGELASARTGEPERAARAYQAAAEIGPLPVEKRREWADLCQRLSQPDRFAEVFASWCDDPGSGATGGDHLLLARTLEELGQQGDALARVERSLELEPENVLAWDTAARLREARGEMRLAAEALSKAAGCIGGRESAVRRHRAATLTEGSDPEWAATLLERAVTADPALAVAEAMLARVAFGLGRRAQAKRAAEIALELARGGAELDEATRLETALIGGRAARSLEDLEGAAHLYAAALEISPSHAEALAARGELLFALGDLQGARLALEARLALDTPDPDRAGHLCLVAASLEAEDPETALQCYAEAVELDQGLDRAHAGRVAILENLSRIDDAVNALEAWAARASDSKERARRLVRAGELELGREGREEPAEVLLREAAAVDPESARGWLLLVSLVWSQGRNAEALDLSERALGEIGDEPQRAGIALIRARALERRGDRREAAAFYREATRIERTCEEGALAGARLLRGLGEWREAADLLNSFVEAHPERQSLRVAPALHQLGRLLAGPLEDMEAAIGVYRRAIAADPELRDARIALAELLAHRPECWNEAIAQHRDLLRDEPARVSSIRALLRISHGRGSRVGVATGLSLLRALGAATPQERIEAPPRPPLSPAATAGMSHPVWETARLISQLAAHEIGEALGVGDGPALGECRALDPIASFRAAVTAAEGELSAPALVPLPTPELGSAVTLVAELALDASSVSAEGGLVNALSSSLGRRARRRVRKALGEVDAAAIAAIDFEAWRADLRGLASARALGSSQVELRVALTAWLQAGDGAKPIPPEADVSQLVGARPEASALLRFLIRSWVEAL
jgi:tetratricopeptide (TPR) repeat protein